MTFQGSTGDENVVSLVVRTIETSADPFAETIIQAIEIHGDTFLHAGGPIGSLISCLLLSVATRWSIH